ncbi:calcium/sodium antiporter [candidate division FCPU426 bacterium]|nr:calcium/sodium antiporter [candidate division FCPU426 bacterium]
MPGWDAFLQLAGGGVLLWLGGEALVRGSSSFALRRNYSQLAVGLTIIGFGTSAPELFVSLVAALQQNQDIALGNVLGSNIANIGLVLGLSACIRVLFVHTSTLRLEIPFMILAGFITWFFCRDALLSRPEGILLLMCMIGFILYYLRQGRLKKGAPPETPIEKDKGILKHAWLEIICLLAGLAGLIAGSKLFVSGAIIAARLFGVSELFIGLSVVALGTSLPELAASVIAVLRGKIDLAVGNIVGSNIFNLFLILGCASVIRPITIAPAAWVWDFPVAIAFSLVLLPLALSQRKISRWEGIVLLSLYGFYLSFIITRK